MTSIIIPAHNEEHVIGRCLGTLIEGIDSGELEIIVACNGCTDRTAEMARSIHPRIKVIETATASKVFALNLADASASAFPRIYLDADIQISLASIRLLSNSLRSDGWAASPSAVMNFENASWAVRAFYDVWLNLPYVREGLCGVGLYALSEAGRRRFEEFPAVINDDGYVRSLFSANERPVIPGAYSTVAAPRTLGGLIRIMTRSRLGIYELRERFPDQFNAETRAKSYGGAFRPLLLQPMRWPALAIYLAVNLLTRVRARRQRASLKKYVWERDESARDIEPVHAS